MTTIHLVLAIAIPVVLIGGYRVSIAIRRRRIARALEALLKERRPGENGAQDSLTPGE